MWVCAGVCGCVSGVYARVCVCMGGRGMHGGAGGAGSSRVRGGRLHRAAALRREHEPQGPAVAQRGQPHTELALLPWQLDVEGRPEPRLHLPALLAYGDGHSCLRRHVRPTLQGHVPVRVVRGGARGCAGVRGGVRGGANGAHRGCKGNAQGWEGVRMDARGCAGVRGGGPPRRAHCELRQLVA